MKLNLGCGGDYKKGYLNVDAFDDTVADKIMSAFNLDLEENSFDEIYMSQLIEHLGIVGGIHSLSECFRVLEPGGKLIIETPDLRKSFEKYLNGDRETRKNILPWIYGVDISGMIHRFCYPEDLLEETLQNTGFINIKKEFFEIDQYEPVLKIICEKPTEYKSYQVMAIFRKKLLENKIINLDDQITSLEIKNLVDFFNTKINAFIKTQDQNNINAVFTNGVIRSPEATKLFFETLVSSSIISKELYTKYDDILNILIEVDFSNVLLDNMRQTSGFVGEQEKLFSTICELGIKTAEKILQNENRSGIIDNLREISSKISSDDKISFLSPKLLTLKANRFFQLGIKEFISNNYETAISMFNKSTSLHRGEIFAYWNLGRLHRLQKDAKKADENYSIALKLVNSFESENVESYRQSLKNEINDQDASKYQSPISSFSEL